MLLRLVDLLLLNSIIKFELNLKIILDITWKAIINDKKYDNNNNIDIDVDIDIDSNKYYNDDDNNDNNNNIIINNSNDNNNDDNIIHQIGLDIISRLSSTSSSPILSLILLHLINLFESNNWATPTIIVEVFIVIYNSSFYSKVYNAPVVRSLLYYCESLINETIIPNNKNSYSYNKEKMKKGGMLDRMRNQFNFMKKDKKKIDIGTFVIVTKVLSIIELFMLRTRSTVQIQNSKYSDSVRTSLISTSTLEEEMKILLSIQFYFCVTVDSDFRLSDSVLAFEFDGFENGIDNEIKNEIKNETENENENENEVLFDFSSPTNNSENILKSFNLLKKSKKVNKSYKTEKAKYNKIFNLLWRVINLFSEQNSFIGFVRTCMLSLIVENMKYYETIMPIVRSQCFGCEKNKNEHENEEKNREKETGKKKKNENKNKNGKDEKIITDKTINSHQKLNPTHFLNASNDSQFTDLDSGNRINQNTDQLSEKDNEKYLSKSKNRFLRKMSERKNKNKYEKNNEKEIENNNENEIEHATIINDDSYDNNGNNKNNNSEKYSSTIYNLQISTMYVLNIILKNSTGEPKLYRNIQNIFIFLFIFLPFEMTENNKLFLKK